MSKIKILLVEDDLNLGFVIQDTLKSNGFDVFLSTNGVEATKKFNEEIFHLCIFDVMMPKKDGFTLAEDIRKQNKEVPILFLTAKSEMEDKIKGLKVGGDDYMTKPFHSEEFILRVKSLLKRYQPAESNEEKTELVLGNIIFDTENYKLIYQDKSEQKLTKKEAKILQLLYQNKNKVLPRDIVLNAVWGQDDYFVGRSLDVFITKLRKYLKEEERAQINNIHGVGFKFTIED